MNIEISGNTYSDFVDGDASKSIVVRNYKGLTGSDVEGIFAESDMLEAAK